MLKSHNDTVAYLNEVARSLEAEDVSALDFDRLRLTLTDLAAFIESAVTDHREYELLREDYIARIAGMEKAIAVAKRGEGHLQSALARIECLPNLSVTDLVDTYRRTQARFRDCFRTSFGFVGGRRVQRGPDFNQFK